MRMLRGTLGSTAVVVPLAPAHLIWGDEALQLTGWPAGFDFESAMRRTNSFGSFILKFIQVSSVGSHQRELQSIASAIDWHPRTGHESVPVLATVEHGDPRGATGPSIRVGPDRIGHAPRGSQDRMPVGAYAATIGRFGDILGAKVYLPDERSVLL
ncbi:MAG: hypothetical protein KGP12_00480 [Actinomycetales bacterium]|nr:hypothetical protein [Actinomycetales bacterium]